MKTFWNVSTINDPEDEGLTVTFETEAEARKHAAWARQQGMMYVSVWAS